MVAQCERLQDICRHDRVSFDTDKYVPPCFCVLQSSMLCSDSDAFPAAPHSFSSLIQSLPSYWGWVCRAPKLWGLRILEIVMENKGGVTIPRWAFGLAATVVALLVVLVIVLIPRGGDNSNTSASGGSNGAAQSNSAAGNSNGAAQSKPTSTVEAGTCGAGASDDQAVLDAAPKNTTWVSTNGGWMGPVSKTAGPMAKSSIENCFEHSAEGGLYAATWAYIQMVESPKDYMPTIVGPGADTLRELRMKDTKTAPVLHISGYRYISYTPERATVRLLLKTPSATYWSADIVMEWHDGDWHYWAPTTPTQANKADPDEFITWGS